MPSLPLDDENLPLFTVGQVSGMLEIQQAFLRRLDEFGVVRPTRSGGGQRRYTRNEITVVQYVVRLADEGMTLPAIRRILQLERRVAELEAECTALREALQARDARWARAAAPPGRAALSGDGRMVSVNGLSLHVAEHGTGDPVLLIHGWPDSGELWRHQVPALVAAGFRVIVPDMRGFGRSDRPADVAAYALPHAVADVTGLLDAFGIESAHVAGHDWGAAVAWLTAMLAPRRVRRLVAISVPHLLAPLTIRQREMGWYQLFFQFEGVAEESLRADDWALLRALSRGNGDQERALADLSRPGALTASLNWYRANLAPRPPGPPPALPPVTAPTLGIWSTGDHYLDGERMRASGDLVQGPWRYEEIDGASHWIPLMPRTG